MFGEVRGKGLMIGIEFRPPTSLSLKMGWNLLHTLDPSLFCQAMLIPLLSEHHVLAQVAGHHLDVIKLLPSLVIDRNDVDYLVQAFDHVIERLPPLSRPGLGSRQAAGGTEARTERF